MSGFHLAETFLQLIQPSRYGRLSKFYEMNDVFSYFHSLLGQGVIRELFHDMCKWDKYTFYHALDVGLLGAVYARQHFPEWKSFAKGCLLHDIGKVTIPKYILQKSGKLTRQEFEQIRQHTIAGEKILQAHSDTEDIDYFARQHHERIDGSGYPSRVEAHALDEWIRCLMIIDVYSAITLDRPYQAPRPGVEALNILIRNIHQFDPHYVMTFMEMVHIFPQGTIVKLSTGETAKIISVPEDEPCYPDYFIAQTGQIRRIPVDFSVRVVECIDLPKLNNTTRQ